MARGRKAAVVETGPVEGPWELPEGWRWESLASVGKWGSGGTPTAKTPSFYGGSIPWFKIGDLRDGWTKPPVQTITELGLAQSSAKMVPANTLLVAMYGSIGKLGLTSFPCATNQAIAFCVPHLDKVELKWLFYYLLGRRTHLLSLGKGGTQQNISQTVLLQEPIPVPSPDTQRRIVARIDELFSELDDAEAFLARARAGLDTYRKSLLKAAVTGELTADWRAANPPTETGEQLLQRILADRKARWEADPKNKGKRYKEPEAADTSELTGLPEGWTWASVAQLGEVVTGATPKTSSPELYEGDVPFFTPSDLDAGYGLAAARRTISERGLQSVRAIPARSILVTCIGATIGKTGFNLVAGATNQQINTVVPASSSYAEFIYLYFAGIGAYEVIERSSSTTLPILNKGDFLCLPMPVPPEADALVIAERTLKALNEAADLDTELQRADESNNLRQSILAAAFRGELVQ